MARHALPFKQAENSITLDEDPQLIINFFQNNFPLTGHGSTMLFSTFKA